MINFNLMDFLTFELNLYLKQHINVYCFVILFRDFFPTENILRSD